MSTYSFSFLPKRYLRRPSLWPVWLLNIACLIVWVVGLLDQELDRSVEWLYLQDKIRHYIHSIGREKSPSSKRNLLKLTLAWQVWPFVIEEVYLWVEGLLQGEQRGCNCLSEEEGGVWVEEGLLLGQLSDFVYSSFPQLLTHGWSDPQNQSLSPVGMESLQNLVKVQKITSKSQLYMQWVDYICNGSKNTACIQSIS